MYIYAIVLIAGLLSGFAGGWKVQAWRFDAARAEAMKLEQKNAAITLAAERRQTVDWQGAIDASRKREQAARADAAGARSELDGVRSDVSSFKRSIVAAPAASCPERANTAADLFEQCSAALEDLAGKADRHASDAVMLRDAWPK